MSDEGEDGRVPLRGDEAELFRDFNRQFVRTAQSRTNAPREIVDDACAFAWQQFMRHQPDRDRNWRAWMLTTAEREAWRLRQIEASHLSLSVDDDDRPAAWDVPDRRDQVAIRMRLREALGALAEVPGAAATSRRCRSRVSATRRSARCAGSRTPASIACSPRPTRCCARSRVARRSPGSTPPRARRGCMSSRSSHLPGSSRRSGRRPALTHDPRAILVWRRAALAIDDYRRIHRRRLGDDPLGERPRDREAARAFDLADAAIRRAVQARARTRRSGLER